MNHATHHAAAVRYQITVLDRNGCVAVELPPKRNLILDQGLDGVAVRSWAESCRYAVVGTGTTPTKRDSGAITFTRAGSTVTASAGFFEVADVGRLLKWDTGEEVRITAFTDPQTVTTSTAGAIAAGEGTIWFVNQTALVTETKRTGTYSTDGGANGSTLAGATLTHKRTFVFSAEAAPVTYREIGWSHTAAAGANLFGRDLLAGVGVSLAAGQQLRVVFELALTISPANPTAYANVVAGWATNGGVCWESLYLRTIAASGEENGNVSSMEPSTTKAVAVLTDASALEALADADRRVAVLAITPELAGSAYTAGSFERTWPATFSTIEANSAAIRGVVLGPNYGGQIGRGLRIRLDSAEAKTSSHTLSFTFRLSWGRVLVNA